MSEHNLPVLIPEREIRRRVEELAEAIDADYPEGTLCLIGVLKGATIFLADLVRAIRRPVRFDFIGISSYGAGKRSSGEVRLTKDLEVSLEGVHALIVEDIVDTGLTLRYLLRVFEARQPLSLRVVALLDKPARRVCEVPVDYVGFRIPDRFVVGYGLDYAEEYRGLRDICVLE